MESLVAFVQQLKNIIADKRNIGQVVLYNSLKLQKIFKRILLSNKYTNFESYRKYNLLKIKLSHLQQKLRSKLLQHQLLRSIATKWPQSNKINVRVVVSLLIHFFVKQINSKIDLNATNEAFFSTDKVNISFLSTKFAPITSSRTIQLPLKLSFPVTLKAYTQALVSQKIKDKLNRKIFVCKFINYGIFYAQKRLSLQTHFLPQRKQQWGQH